MASPLDSLLDIVKRKVAQKAGSGPAGSILTQITDMLGQRGRPASKAAGHNVRPASEDPYGDPADQKGAHNVKPASQDPYGDPADEKH
ncbi:MAG: translation initiation factor [Myxococcaceae bacterium]|nr:translation initiation factor [Myxococcaceae bacterium]